MKKHILWINLSNIPLRFCDGVHLAHLLSFCLVLLCVFTVWAPSCDVRYDFRIETMFGSSLPPVVCRRAHVLFTLFVLVCALWCPTHIVLWFFLFFFPSSIVLYIASFSGFSVFYCPFVILLHLFKHMWLQNNI